MRDAQEVSHSSVRRVDTRARGGRRRHHGVAPPPSLIRPFADLAVRTWAARLVPGCAWPPDEPGFAAVWRAVTGSGLPAATLLALAAGARHDQQLVSEPVVDRR